MTTPAANITECIQYTPDNLAELDIDFAPISTNMTAWIAGLFGTSGIFTDVADYKQRTVIDWHGTNNTALDLLPSLGEAGVYATGAAIDAVIRTCWAVHFAYQRGYITLAQRTAVVTLWNAQWV